MSTNNNKKSNPFAGILFGIIFIIGGSCLLWWNESNNVKNLKTVSEITDNAIEVPSDKVDSANEGKLVITSGDIKVNNQTVMDETFMVGVSTPVLERVVEMYQWKEDSKTDDNDNTTYSYTKTWSEKHLDSSTFHDGASHTNPDSMPYSSKIMTASSVNLGAYLLSNEEKQKMDTNASLTLNMGTSTPTGYSVKNNYITNSVNMDSPNIGDIRISYKYNDWKSATVLAVQKGTTFAPFISKAGKEVDRVEEGNLSKERILRKMTDENNTLKWILRGVGCLFIVIGYIALLGPITFALSYIPIFGNLVNSALSTIAALIGLSHSLLVIAIAWFVFRPLISAILIAAIVLIIFLIRKIAKNSKKKKEEESAPKQTAEDMVNSILNNNPNTTGIDNTRHDDSQNINNVF